MRFHRLMNFWPVAIVVLGLHGCASTSPINGSGFSADELSGENLDLLFVTEFPVASKDEALVKAARAYRDGEFDKAQFYLVRALKFDTTDADVLTEIGNLHVRLGNTTLAARAFHYAIQQQPQHAAALQGIGLLYFKSGNDDEAHLLLESAVASDPKLWRAHNALGVIADNRREFSTAQAHYGDALSLQPKADSILINRGYSKFLIEDFDGAAVDFIAVTERSNNSRAWQNLALVYGTQGHYEAALESFLHAADEPDAYNETGAIAMRNGDSEAAMHYLSEAVRLSPTYFARAEKNIAQLRKKNARKSVN